MTSAMGGAVALPGRAGNGGMHDSGGCHPRLPSGAPARARAGWTRINPTREQEGRAEALSTVNLWMHRR
jgi:hypothetical protein